MTIPFQIFKCDECGERFPLNRSARCPACGAKESAPDPLVEGRRVQFGQRIKAAREMRDKWSTKNITFARRGARPELHDYFKMLSWIAFTRSLQLGDEAQRLFDSVEWKASDEASEALDRLIDVCVDLFFSAACLAGTPPPPAFVSVHRQAARVLCEYAAAFVSFIEALLAPSVDEVKEAQTTGQEALDTAHAHLRRFSEYLELTERALELTPGWWGVEDEYDVGRAVWEGVGAATTSLEDAASYVRERLPLPRVQSLQDQYAAQLMPPVALVFHDPLRLVAKAEAAESVLDKASHRGASWATDAALLVNEVWLGHKKFVEQLIQMAFLLQSDAPRRILINGLADAYSKLLEGAFRHFGTIIMTASRFAAGKQTALDQTVVDRSSPAAVAKYFQDVGLEIWEGSSSLLRNAEAHYSYEITDTGIVFRDFDVRRQIRREDALLDDDFVEELASLTETLASFEIALLPYVWTHPSQEVQKHLDKLSEDPAEQAAVVRLVGGLRGFVEMLFDEAENGALRVRSRYLGESETPFVEALPILAAAWRTWSTPEVELQLEGAIPQSLSFKREDWLWAPDQPKPIQNHGIGVVIRHVREDTETLNREQRLDLAVRYLFLPFFLQVNDLVGALSGSDDLSIAGELAAYASWMANLLNDLTVPAELADLHRRLEDSVERFRSSVARYRMALTRDDRHWVQRARKMLFAELRTFNELFRRSSDFLIDTEE